MRLISYQLPLSIKHLKESCIGFFAKNVNQFVRSGPISFTWWNNEIRLFLKQLEYWHSVDYEDKISRFSPHSKLLKTLQYNHNAWFPSLSGTHNSYIVSAPFVKYINSLAPYFFGDCHSDVDAPDESPKRFEN